MVRNLFLLVHESSPLNYCTESESIYATDLKSSTGQYILCTRCLKKSEPSLPLEIHHIVIIRKPESYTESMFCLLKYSMTISLTTCYCLTDSQLQCDCLSFDLLDYLPRNFSVLLWSQKVKHCFHPCRPAQNYCDVGHAVDGVRKVHFHYGKFPLKFARE